MHRRDSTASDLKFPMYLVPLDQLRTSCTEERKLDIIVSKRIKTLLRRGELVRWEDLPIDAHISLFLTNGSGWNHPDPHGVQLKTFLRVMKRLRSGDILQVEMNWFVQD